MGVFEVFIEVEDSWRKLGEYIAETGEDAVRAARRDLHLLEKYYALEHIEFVNLDYNEKT